MNILLEHTDLYVDGKYFCVLISAILKKTFSNKMNYGIKALKVFSGNTHIKTHK